MLCPPEWSVCRNDTIIYHTQNSPPYPFCSGLIISKDTGFDPLIQHMRAKQVKVHRFEDVTDIPIIKKKLAPPLPSVSAHEPDENGHSTAPTFVDMAIETVAPAMNGNSAQVQAPPAPVDTDAQECSSQASQNASNPSQLSRNERIAFVVVHL